MVSAPILVFPDFELEFTVEIDACKSGVGVVLSQNSHPINFFSCKLSGRIMVASVYVKEIFAITQAVSK